MSFLERPVPPGAAPVWATLDEAQRAEIVAVLARLIARMGATQAETGEGETGHE
jgi:glycine cleavage system regulatory protein